jgi:predicted nuclease of predicted toxin-antitoxin system
MNLVADESIDKPIVEGLRNVGHLVYYIAEMSPSLSDDDVLQIANQKSAPLLTSDKDFGELIFRQGLVSHGVVLIRLSGVNGECKSEITIFSIDKHADEIIGNFTVISPSSVRIRRIKYKGNL